MSKGFLAIPVLILIVGVAIFALTLYSSVDKSIFNKDNGVLGQQSEEIISTPSASLQP